MSDGYTKVPHSVSRDGTLGVYAFRVYVALAGHINGEPWPMRLADLATECCMSTKQVARELPVLGEHFGLRYEGGKGKLHRFWWDSQSDLKDSQSDLKDSQSDLKRQDEEVERTHSPIRKDSQSDLIGLTVLLPGTPLKEPKNRKNQERGVHARARREPVKVVSAVPPEFAEDMAAKYPQWPRDKLDDLIAEAVSYYAPLIAKGKHSDLPACVRGSLRRRAEQESTRGTYQHNFNPPGIPAFSRSAGGNGTLPPATGSGGECDSRIVGGVHTRRQ